VIWTVVIAGACDMDGAGIGIWTLISGGVRTTRTTRKESLRQRLVLRIGDREEVPLSGNTLQDTHSAILELYA
jgi:hypothetical protein